MRTKGFTWYWPLSFLAALGQLLLLLTDNPGGPGAGRVLLALWVVSIPGYWLGHLLTKPDLRLPEALGLRFALSLGLAYVFILLRKPLSPDAPALAVTIVSLGIALVYTFNPGRRAESPRFGEPGRGAGTAALWAALLLAAMHLWTGPGAALNPADTDTIHAAEALAAPPGDHAWFAPASENPRAGRPRFSPERSLFHPWLDLICRASGRPPETVLRFLPVLTAPMLFLSLCLLGGIILESRKLGLASGLLGIFLMMLHADPLWSAGPTAVALCAWWSALALFLRGLDEPRPLHLVAWVVAIVAAAATHWGVTLVLLPVLLIVILRAVTSVVRLQETLPAVVAYVTPAAVALGLYALVRWGETGAVDSFAGHAQGLYILGRGLRILDPLRLSFPEQLAFALSMILILTHWKRALADPKIFVLILAPYAVKATAYNPWLLPELEQWRGSHVHLLPWIFPLPVGLVALGDWSWQGLRRSAGWVWLRLIGLGGTAVATLSVLVLWVLQFPYPAPAATEASPRSPEPEAVAAYAQGVAAEELVHAPGDTVTLLATWPTPLDPLTHRVRVEMQPARPPASSGREALGRTTRNWRDWALGRGDWVIRELPMAAITDSLGSRIRVPLPQELPPGSYAVGVGALPGLQPAHRLRDGYLYLEQSQTTLAVTGP